MAKMLVLMRHGKARRPQDGQPDFERRLTAYGARALQASVPCALTLMPKDALVEMWSSPAARAQETALVAQEACRRVGVCVQPELVLVDALWDQDLPAFVELVQASRADVVFAVGHNPFIETAVGRLTGSYICCATGACAAVLFTDEGTGHAVGKHYEATGVEQGDTEATTEGAGEEHALSAPPARLLWFVQGPRAQHWQTLATMERVLGEAARTVQERWESFLATPDDVETMHKFRVSIRTMRSLLAFVEPWQRSAQNKAGQKGLRGIVRKTSRLREFDVLAEQAHELEGAPVELAAFCEGLAAQERARVYTFLSSKRTAKALRTIVKQLECVQWRKRVEAQGLAPTLVRQRFDMLVQQLDQDMAELDLADAQATHDVRKNAKRVRYDAERFEELLGDDAVDIARGMEAHQDDLGAICDARVNMGIIDELDMSDVPDCVIQGLNLLRAQSEAFLADKE